jgi:xylose dehydrogenase (NAD/NADP)
MERSTVRLARGVSDRIGSPHNGYSGRLESGGTMELLPDPPDWRTEPEGTVRFALVGVGWWTREFVLPAVASSDHCEATAVVSGSPQKRERVRERHGSVERALSYDEFAAGTASDAYDAAYVCTPNATHREHVVAAAELGKDVLCEKPMEASVERAAQLVAACERAGVVLMVAYRMHTEPAVRRARRVIREGVIGDPVLVHGENSQRLLELVPDPEQWRLDPALSGYGASVSDLGIYPLNTTRFLLDADPVSVQSMMRSGGGAFADVPDEVATFSVAFDDGTRAAYTSSQNAAERTRLEVVGTEGRVELDPAFHMETSLTVERGDTEARIGTDGIDQMEAEFDYFATRLLDGEPVYADGEHGLVDMRTVAAVHEAAETGRTVAVE